MFGPILRSIVGCIQPFLFHLIKELIHYFSSDQCFVFNGLVLLQVAM